MPGRGIIPQAVIAFALSGFSVHAADMPDWRAFADCAAGYLANVEARRDDPSRTPEMADMVALQAEDYRSAAIKASSLADAALSGASVDAAIDGYIQSQSQRFVTMERSGELNAFLEACPQIDYETLN
jgi:hypothetical protein